MNELLVLYCSPLPQGSTPLSEAEQQRLHSNVADWQLSQDNKSISREFKFKNFHETMAFVNGVAWIAHHQDHHPELSVTYNRCKVIYSTHSVGGLSINDYICAARIDAFTR